VIGVGGFLDDFHGFVVLPSMLMRRMLLQGANLKARIGVLRIRRAAILFDNDDRNRVDNVGTGFPGS
jgi:hypothetical protein